MEGGDQTPSLPPPSTEYSVEEEETVVVVGENEDEAPQRFPQRERSGVFHNPNAQDYVTENDDMQLMRDDTWSCVIVVLTFWFFVSMTLILGVYGSQTLRLGPNSSILIKPSPLFVEYIKVEKVDASDNGIMLYGFYGNPPLDIMNSWAEIRKTSLFAGMHKEWAYYLNMGSHLNISYGMDSLSSSSLVLVIAQGNEGLGRWLEDPSYPNTTLSWNIIHGSGMIQQKISKSSTYYIAVGNLNSETVKVELHIRIRAFLYNTTEAYYECSLADVPCSLKVFFPRGNTAVLTSPGIRPAMTSIKWYVKLSYGPRWSTYLLGIGGMTLLVLVAFHLWDNFGCTRRDGSRAQLTDMGSQRSPLLSHKDDDLSSLGSSYDSVSQDYDDLQEGSEGTKEGECNNNTRRLCPICFDALRDSFFLPCGHCVACFACGTRIAEAAGTCPICRRRMKKVRKIFMV